METKLPKKDSRVRKLLKAVKDVVKPTIDLPDGSKLGIKVRPKFKDGKVKKLKVKLELDAPLSEDVDMYVYVNKNILQITHPGDEDFSAGVKFTKKVNFWN